MSAALRVVSLPLRMSEQNNLDPHKPVCLALFQGDVLSHRTYGANQGHLARRDMKRIRARGVAAYLVWLNVGPWCADLWTQDLARPLHIHPDNFYGEPETGNETVPEDTGIIPKLR